MFTSPASSPSSSGPFGCAPIFGQGNQKGDAFAPNTLSSGTVSPTRTRMAGYGGTSSWAFTQTSSPLSSTTTFGAPSYSGFGSATSALGHSSSGNFGSQPMFMHWNQRGDSFASKSLDRENLYGSPTGMPNSHGTSSWTFNQTSSSFSTPTTFGAPSYSGFGSATSALGHSSGGNFGSQPMFMHWNQRGDSFASKSLDRENLYGSPTGMPNSHGTSSWTFNQTSSSFSTPTTFGAPSSYILGSLTSIGPHVTRSTFNYKQSNCGGQERGSRIANYKRTSETGYSAEKLVSISAMPVYKAKSHKELRWEDYKLTEFSTNSWGTTTPMKPNPLGKPFHLEATGTPTWKFPGPTSTSQPLPFSSSTTNSLSTVTPAPPLNSFSPFLSKNKLTSPASTMSTSFKSPTFTSPGCTSPSWSLAPLNQNPFTNPFTSLPTQMSSSSLSSPTFAPFITPSSLSGFWPTPIVTAPANSVSSGLGSTINQPTTLFTPSAPSTQNNYKEEIAGNIGEIKSTEKPSSAASPFGTLPPKSQLSFEDSRSTQSIQYGISSIPVKDKPASVRYSLLTTRHLSRRNNLPVQKYHPKLNVSKMPFFSETKEMPVAAFIPRENPRALVVSPEKWPRKAITEDMHEERFSGSMNENGKDDPTDLFPTVVDVPSKLQRPGYYTNPKISELESKERAEPGFCSHVNDFVIGRHGYGSIKFLGETDVRNLDLETYVQFNNREVIVYIDETNKPPVGQGLNKPAEITLLNIKCIDKRTGVEYKDGWKIDKYKEMLKKKVVAQGGEFVSYDPVEGEWKFRVQHF